MTEITVVSNRLPIRLSPGRDGRVEVGASDGGLVSALRPVLKERGGAWVGWTGSHGEPGAADQDALGRFGDREGYRLVPVALSAAEHELYYEGACNRVLWPLLHGLSHHSEPSPADAAAYADVNSMFAEVAARDRPETVWVHDYHLLSVGTELRRRLPRSRLGFFLHIPFPSPAAMAALGWGADLLPSLASFDVIGFQTERDRRNFLDWARAVGGPMGVPSLLEARSHVFRISVDFRRYHEEAAAPAVAERARAIRAGYAGRRILLGVDRLDYTKGIPERLRAFAALLEGAPELRGKVVFTQLAIPSRTRIPAYESARAEMEGLAASINARFAAPGWTPVDYVYGSWSHDELLARYVAADVAVVTPLRDGMNLVAKEFMAANRGGGVLVLSRFAGAADELGADALLVDPADTPATATALARALAMPAREREARVWRAQAHLRAHDVHGWAAAFLDALAGRGLGSALVPRRDAPAAFRRSAAGRGLSPAQARSGDAA